MKAIGRKPFQDSIGASIQSCDQVNAVFGLIGFNFLLPLVTALIAY